MKMFKKLEQWKDRRSLEAAVAKSLDQARDHDSNGIAAGHAHYKTLFLDCVTHMETYAAKYSVPMTQLQAELPAIEKLHELAIQQNEIRQKPVVQWTARIALAFGGLFAAGLAAGVVHLGYQLIFRYL